MSTRYVRNTAILLAKEVTYGVDPTPTQALLVSNLTINPLSANNVDRANVKPYFGANEQLVGTHFVQCGFDLELAGSGTAGTAPLWGAALQACAFAEDVQSAYVAYKPVTDSQPSATIYWYDSGTLHKLTGARGTVKLNLGLGNRPVLSFNFTGVYNAPTAVAVPAVDLSGWITPKVVIDANTGDVTFGAAYATGAVTGGTTFPSTGMEIDVGNKVEFSPLLGIETIEVTDRESTFKAKLKLTSAEEVAKYASVIANTTQAVSLTHGTTAGNIILVHGPAVQLINPTKEDEKGQRLIGFDGRLIPTTAGNDELVIVAK